MKWFAAEVIQDIWGKDPCPECNMKKFHCTNCWSEGRAIHHMWGYVPSGPYFNKGSRVMIAKIDAWFSEHDHNGIHMSYQYPERYLVFDPNVKGKKISVTRAYAITHLRRVRPFRDMTEMGEKAHEDYQWEMSR